MPVFRWVKGVDGRIVAQIVRLIHNIKNDLAPRIVQEYPITDDEADELSIDELAQRYPRTVESE